MYGLPTSVTKSSKVVILKECSQVNVTFGLFTNHEVKMAGNWPSSFLFCLWTEMELDIGQVPFFPVYGPRWS